MRLVTFATADASSAPRVGLLAADGGIIDIAATASRAGLTLPFDASDMVSLIAAGEPARDALLRLSTAASAVRLPQDAARLMAPIPRPRKNVFCVGWNYLEHFEEGESVRKTGENLPEHPVFFSKAVTAVIGPFDPIPFDARVSTRLDWEVELGVVIGRSGKNIRQADAMDHVFGYTVIDDVSARDLQRQHGGQWLKGKSLDGTCPMGPCIVTRDELDAGNLRLTTRVNGIVKQDSRTCHMYFSLPRLIEELSLGMTLEAGDVLSTGTPPGVGFARNPPQFLAAGDVIESEIEGIGCLRNRVGAAA